MNKSAIAFACALFLANVSLADTTIAASKSLDARVDVVGNKGGEWCDKQVSLKFLTTDGKELSQSAYDQMLPKVQSLLTSQCAKVANVDISRGKTVEKFSYANGTWTSAGSEAVKAVDANTDKSPEVKWQNEYFDLLNEGDFKKIGKKFRRTMLGFTYQEDGLGFDRRSQFGKLDVYEDVIKNSKVSERTIIDVKRDENYAIVTVEEKGTYKSDLRSYGYTARDKYRWYKYDKSLESMSREMVAYNDLDVAVKEPNNFNSLEIMAFLAKSPLENETYLSYYVASKNAQVCKQYSKALRENNLNDINGILSRYEKEAKSYQEKVKSLKDAELSEKVDLSLSRSSYDEQLGGIKYKVQNLKNINQFDIKLPCNINLEPFKHSTFTTLNIEYIPMSPRMLTPLTQDREYQVDLKFTPMTKEVEGKKIFIISPTMTKMTHIKTNTVVVEQTISSSEATKSFDKYIEEQARRQKEYDGLSEECKALKWLGGGKGCK